MDVVVDDDEVNEIDQGLEEIGVGRNVKNKAAMGRSGSAVYGASHMDNNFVERFQKEKKIEMEKK